MKKIFSAILSLIAFLQLNAQSSGAIYFTEGLKLQMDIQGADEEMLKKIPKYHNVNKVLIFNGKESLYKNIDKNTEMEMNGESDNGGQVKMVVKSPESTLYNDIANNKMIHSQEFFGKQFLIKGDMKKKMWKMTGETKSFLDFVCQKAILQDTSGKVEAWFTTKLPANIGPANYYGLPGTILMVDFDNGQRTFTASKIDLRELKSGEIEVPTKGKEVTSEEFEKIKKDKMAEMGGTMGKGGTMKIMINREEHN